MRVVKCSPKPTPDKSPRDSCSHADDEDKDKDRPNAGDKGRDKDRDRPPAARKASANLVQQQSIFAAGDCCCLGWPERESAHWFQMRLWSQAR